MTVYIIDIIPNANKIIIHLIFQFGEDNCALGGLAALDGDAGLPLSGKRGEEVTN